MIDGQNSEIKPAFVFSFGDSQDEKQQQQQVRDRIADIDIDWSRRDRQVGSVDINVESSEGVNPEMLQLAKDTLIKAGNVVGIFEPREPGSQEGLVQLTLQVVEQDVLGEDTHGDTSFYTVRVSRNLMNPELDPEAHLQRVRKILGQEVETESPEVRILDRYLTEATVVHEIYHQRQKHILFLRQLRNEGKFKIEPGPLSDYISEQYEYDEDERGARAFEIRYLVEEKRSLAQDSLEAQVLQKYIDYQLDIERRISKSQQDIMRSNRLLKQMADGRKNETEQ